MAHGLGRGGGGSLSVDVDSLAVVFAILHGIMLLLYVVMVLTEPSSVFVFLVLFGAVRVATFGTQAAAEDPLSTTANGVIFAAGPPWDLGILALLYSAHILVLNRGVVSGVFTKKTITRITRNVVRLLLGIAVVAGIRAWMYHTQAADLFETALEDYNRGGDRQRFSADAFAKADSLRNKGRTFQQVTVYTSLAVTALLAVQTVILLSWERAGSERRATDGQSMNTRAKAPYAMYMPFLITAALLTRSIYRTVEITTGQRSKGEFYLLGALPELLALLSFAAKGVVPKKKDVVPPVPECEKDLVGV